MARGRSLLPIFLALTALPADASEHGPVRQINLTVYGEERCPRARDEEEIVVCARRPEEERYRVPPALRERRDRPLETSWSARNDMLESDARTQRPDSCSPVGAGGQSGCTGALVRQWLAERRMRRTP